MQVREEEIFEIYPENYAGNHGYEWLPIICFPIFRPQRMAFGTVTGIFSALIVFDMNLTSDSESLGRKGIEDSYDFIVGKTGRTRFPFLFLNGGS